MGFDIDPEPELLTFDCYGTLIDWDSALRVYVADVLAGKTLAVPLPEFYDTWYYRHALPMLQGPFLIYRQLLQNSLQDALREYGADVNPSDGAEFGDAMAQADPFPDTIDVLHRLVKHFKLATISNSQDDIISHAIARMGDLFDVVLTAETTRTYKPSPELFELVLRTAGVPAARTIHIAQSQYVDLPRSVPMGMRTVWINRNAQTLNTGTPKPHAVLPDLRGLPTLLRIAT